MIDLFKLASVLTDADIERAVKEASENSTLMGRMLVAAGVIDESMLNAGLRCELLQSEGYISTEQAVFLLPYCQKRGLSLDEGMEQLGWTTPTTLEWQPAVRSGAVDLVDESATLLEDVGQSAPDEISAVSPRAAKPKGKTRKSQGKTRKPTADGSANLTTGKARKVKKSPGKKKP